MQKEKMFQMRTDSGLLLEIDDWRRRQGDIPSRAEAIRVLVRKGIQSEAVCAAEGTEGRQ